MTDSLPTQEEEEVRLATMQPLMSPDSRTRASVAYAAVKAAFERLAEVEGRYDTGDDLSGLDDAVRIFEAVDDTSRWNALAVDRRADWGRRACLIYRERYENAGAEGDLDKAIATAASAAQAAEAAIAFAGDLDAAVRAVAALVAVRTGNPVEAILAGVRDAMGPEIERLRVQAAGSAAAAFAAYGEQLAGRFDRDRRRGDADQAADWLRRARTTRAGSGLLPDPGTNRRLGATLLLRFKDAGRPADITEAIAVLREGVEHANEPGERAAALDALGCALLARSEHAIGQDDLMEAVERLSAAVDLEPASAWFRANLGTALIQRYGRHGDHTDATRGLALLESALAAIAPSAPDRRRIEQNVLAARNATGTSGARALSARTLVDATPLGARSRPGRVGGLAVELIERAERTLDLAGIDEAVSVATQARDAAMPRSVDRPSVLHVLGRALATRYAVLGAEDDLDAAIAALTEAAREAGDGASERPDFLITLAETQAMHATRTGASQDDQAAAATFAAAYAAGERQNATAARRAASAWLSWAAEDHMWDAAAEAGRLAAVADERIYRLQFGRENREKMAGTSGAIHTDAAVALVRSGRPVEALLTLEHGRARQLSEGLERDTAELHELAAVGRADLAEAFRAAARSEGAAERAGDPGAVRRADAVLRTLTEEIRRVPGHETFLQQTDIDELLRICAEVPLVYLAAGQFGAAVIAAGPGGQVRAQLLDGVDSYVVGEMADTYLAALQARNSASGTWLKALDELGETLGAMLWPAVLSVLGGERRAILVPAGLFGLLPVQVGWWRGPSGRSYAVDEVELSLAPNARTVAACRRMAAAVDVSSVLTVAAPERHDVAALRLARAESDGVRSAFTHGEQLAGPQATKAEVLAALGRHDVYHFACHGRTAVRRPLDSELLLAGDDTLRVRDLLDTSLPGARLAVLSACETAAIGLPFVDEVIGLPAGFLQAGVAGVIGTSWEVGDESAALVVRRFFDIWPGRSPAAALRAAQRWMRESTNAEKQAAYPDVAAGPPDGFDAEELDDWSASRDHTGIEHWGGFVHTGG